MLVVGGCDNERWWWSLGGGVRLVLTVRGVAGGKLCVAAGQLKVGGGGISYWCEG